MLEISYKQRHSISKWRKYESGILVFYKYLGILELDKIKQNEVKEVFWREYLRRVDLVVKSILNGRNELMAINTWAGSQMRYGAGILK